MALAAPWELELDVDNHPSVGMLADACQLDLDSELQWLVGALLVARCILDLEFVFSTVELQSSEYEKQQ